MIRAIFTISVFVLCACGQPSSAPAEPAIPSTWNDPSGRVTITIPADWQEVDAANAPAGVLGGELAIFAQRAEGALAQCEIYKVTQQVPAPATRELLNEATDQFRDSPEMQAYRSRVNVQRADLTDINGIRVLDVRSAPPTLVRFERRFFFATNGVLELYTLACASPDQDQTARVGANALAMSLQIRDDGTTP